MISECDLQCRVYRLRSGVGKEYLREFAAREADQAFGELESTGVTQHEGGHIVELPHAGAHSFDDTRMAVAQRHAPEAGSPIENLPPITVMVIHATGRGDQTRMGLEVPVGSERHPIGGKIATDVFCAHL